MEHKAAVAPARGKPLVVQTRKTPSPGADEVVIEVKSVALNPVDHIQRDLGFPSVTFPAVLGSDVAGVVVAVGPGVTDASIKVGTRVCAFASSFYEKGPTATDYGAFQEKVCVPSSAVTPIPDAMSFNEAAVLPMAFITTWNGLWCISVIPLTGPPKPLHKPEDKKGLLVWGAGSSVGSMAVQVAKSLGFSVYATASAKHHDYIKGLGAKDAFDYKDTNVVANIVKAVKDDGVAIDSAYIASGSFSDTFAVLKSLQPTAHLNIAEAPFSFSRLPWLLFPNYRNTTAKFVSPPSDRAERNTLTRFACNVFLKEKLASGEIVSAPKLRVIGKGLQGMQEALEVMKKGVSGEKLVVEL